MASTTIRPRPVSSANSDEAEASTTQSPVPRSATSSLTHPGRTQTLTVNSPPGSPLGECLIALVAYSQPIRTTSSARGVPAITSATTLRTAEIAAGIPGKVISRSGALSKCPSELTSLSVGVTRLEVTGHNDADDFLESFIIATHLPAGA